MTGCIEWAGYVHPSGYGVQMAWVHGKNVSRYAHRLVWEECFGPIPVGACIHHRCENRACVNPEHLQLMSSHSDHVREHARLRPRTHCKRGHEFTPENTYTFVYVNEGGKVRRQCKECNRQRQAALLRERSRAQGGAL